MYARIMLLLVAFSMGIHATSQQNIPQVTIVLVLDQFALHQYRKVRTFLNGGINFLTKNGTSCMEAYYPHARPATATGHAALSTGAYAKDHGIIANSWITPEGTTVVSTEDTPYNAAIFSPDGKTYNSGASSRNILAETLSDSFMKTHRENGIVFGISLKDRAAIPMAGKLGKAIWFDGQSGRFTSSKAYFSTLPEWLRKFNDDSDIDELTHTEWKQRFTEQSGAYSFASISDYSHAGLPMSLVNTRHPFPSDKKSRYSLYIKTPDANQAVLNVAKAALSEYKKKDPGKQLLLWVSMSSLDYAGHVYGPDSKEAIDIIYQVDAQLEKFITHVENLFGKSNIFWAFTSDHGIMPIPEVARKQGNTQAKRIDSNALIKKLNEHAKKHYGLDNLVVEFEIPNIYFKHSVFSTLSTEKKKLILNDFKKILLAIDGIETVWTEQELLSLTFPKNSIESWYQLQHHGIRSGDMTVKVTPYTYLTRFETGTSHCTPYKYDVEVPALFYSPGRIKGNQTINTPVSMLSLPATIADILKIPRPESAIPEKFPLK